MNPHKFAETVNKLLAVFGLKSMAIVDYERKVGTILWEEHISFQVPKRYYSEAIGALYFSCEFQRV